MTNRYKGILLSIYAAAGIFLGTFWKIEYRIQQNIINHDYLREGIPKIFVRNIGISRESALIWSSILSVCSFIFLFILYQIKGVKKSYSFFIFLPFLIILVVIIPGFKNSVDILFFLMLAAVVCVGSWLSFDKFEEIKEKNQSTEVLRLMHQEYLELLKLLIWATIVMITGLIWKSVILERENLMMVLKQPIYTVPPCGKMMEINSWMTLYLTIGVVGAVILETYYRVVEIRRKIAPR